MKPKRLISLLVAVCMMITMLPLSAVTAFAEDTPPSWSQDKKASSGGYMYAYKVNEDGRTATITRFLGPDDPTNYGPYDIEIPTELGGFPVTGLGDYSFAHYYFNHSNSEVHLWNELCNSIRSVTIPQSVTSIGYEAFCHCVWLKSLTINGYIESMGDGAFEGCKSLTTFSLDGNIQKISDYAFSGCDALKNVTIPQSVTSIGDYAFSGCALKDVSFLPQSVTSIGYAAFFGCDLTTVSLGENIKTIGGDAFEDCYWLTDVTIPQSVTSIGRNAFYECVRLKSLTINGAIESMGANAFYKCKNLTTLSLGEKIKTIGDWAFDSCSALDNVIIPDSVTSIGSCAFLGCTSLKTLSLGKNIETIGDNAFNGCSSLSTITIPEKVTAIKGNTFYDCSSLTYIMLPAGLKSFHDKLVNCPAGDTDGAIYYNNYKAAADDLLYENEHDINFEHDPDRALKNRNFLYLCKVTFDANGGTLTDKGGNLTDHAVVSAYKTEKINADDLAAIPNPTRAGYKFTGWYTEKGQPFDVNEIITKDMTEDITFYAHWESAPNAPVCHPLTVTGGTVTVEKDGQTLDIVPVVTGDKKTYSVPDGAKVTVTLDKTLIQEGMVFDIWSTGKFSLPLGQDYKAESITFTMNSGVDIAAQYRDASIEDDGPGVLGTAAIIGTAAVGTAVLGYQAYSLGAEFAGKLMALPYFPSNRSALAMMLWEDASKPMPESELLYPDVGQEEQDMDLQHAARWAMENELIPDLNDEGTAPEEMKFYPDNAVSKLDVLNAWQKAQELKNN